MTLERVLAQRSKQSTKWTAQVTNINEYVCIVHINAPRKIFLVMRFFCHETAHVKSAERCKSRFYVVI